MFSIGGSDYPITLFKELIETIRDSFHHSKSYDIQPIIQVNHIQETCILFEVYGELLEEDNGLYANNHIPIKKHKSILSMFFRMTKKLLLS